MALQTSGAISLSNVNVELKFASNAVITLNDAAVRKLLAVPSGAISLSNAYGKANEFAFTISTNQTNADLRTLAINAGWSQSGKLTVTINSGVVISSNSTATPGMTIAGAFPDGLSLINNGHIVGMGGAGGAGNDGYIGDGYGSPGGLALSVGSAVSITNNGVIAGGGGGGGGGHSNGSAGGGGGGGGRSGSTNSPGGAAGYGTAKSGASGNPGTFTSAGIGGMGGEYPQDNDYGMNGMDGGDWGVAGRTMYSNLGVGGSGGAAVSGNANITWAVTGTRLGAIT